MARLTGTSVRFHLTARTHSSGKGLRGYFGSDGLASAVQPLRGYPDPREHHDGHLTLWIHGYNNSQDDIAAVWDSTAEALSRRDCSVDDVVAFYWPGDQWSSEKASALAYPAQVVVARRAAVLLSEYLLDGRFRRQLRLTIVAHSLGCLLALEAIRLLRDSHAPHITLERLLLMAAAVPQGLCVAGADPYGHTVVAVEERVLYSVSDRVLAYAFRMGQRFAQTVGWAQVPALRTRGGLRAVGREGGPDERWQKIVPMTDFDHGDYWKKPKARDQIRKVMPTATAAAPVHEVALRTSREHVAPSSSAPNRQLAATGHDLWRLESRPR